MPLLLWILMKTSFPEVLVIKDISSKVSFQLKHYNYIEGNTCPKKKKLILDFIF